MKSLLDLDLLDEVRIDEFLQRHTAALIAINLVEDQFSEFQVHSGLLL